MRLAFVTPFYAPEYQFGGPPRKIHALAKHLAAAGVEVSVVTFDSKSPGRNESTAVDDIPVRYLPWRGQGLKQFPRSLDALRSAIARCDVAHLFGLYNFIIPPAAKAAKKSSTPYVAEPLGMHEPKQRNIPFKKIYNRFIGNPLLREAATIIATSDVERDELARHFPKEHITVRRNGIDTAPFQRSVDPTTFLADHGLDPQRRRVVFLGRLSPIKNLVALIEAFAQANPEATDLLLIGPENEPDYAGTLRQTARHLGVETLVHFIPPVDGDNKIAALQSSTLFVLPSITESYGNAAAEALAAGTPALVTTGCGIFPIIHDRAGLAVPPDAPSLATGLSKLLSDPSPHTRHLPDLPNELSWDTPIQDSLNLYQSLLTPQHND